MKHATEAESIKPPGPVGGLAGWIVSRLRNSRRAEPRLAVLERITLAPRQMLALIEADGRRFLVATSPDGTPAFQSLDSSAVISRRGQTGPGAADASARQPRMRAQGGRL